MGARPPPSPHRRPGREGRGRHSPRTSRERGGDGRAGGGRSAGALPAASRGRPGPLVVCCAFAARFLVSSGPGGRVPSGRRTERLPPPGPLHTFSLSRAAGYVQNAGPACPGRRRRGDSRGAPGAAERRGAGRGLWARRGRAGAPGRRRRPRKDGGAPEPLRSPQRGPVPPDTMALAEVVVCAVGRVVTLPAVEITAQATALLVLVMLSAAEDNDWESPLFSGARGQPSEPRPRCRHGNRYFCIFLEGGKGLREPGGPGLFKRGKS